MATTTYGEARIKQRFNVTLTAAGVFEGHENQEHQFRISNLSATGARLHVETRSHVKAGMRIRMKIFIPHTILHIPSTGDIMWVTRNDNAVSCGVKFTDILSETMVHQLTRDSAPATI